ncbi:hypothetical protein J122_1032 [Marinobacter excellens LAMA 842]|uniref:Uncharacterized protein n=1 Tax=Marinobacter excellens LAMA 842 TaxID=1306954 RepID=A0A137SEQ4_9GAMM|nr:hypothetical protein J122_1032 [Marinobacter excellens LAMA 842]
MGPETPLWFAFIMLYDVFEFFIPFCEFLWNKGIDFYFSRAIGQEARWRLPFTP